MFINLISFSIAFFASGSLSEYGNSLWFIITLAPWVCASVRRFHDIDRTGWWILLYLIPVIGWIALIVLYSIKGTVSENRFGKNFDNLTHESGNT